ncbi:radical SAM enzyme [Coccomyxa subellipsoidea C-169]|uniref:Radical S-adenosyl methionine domain-containing protein 1, mitochondrial n=1 Tax=Coccomyxa subellipsoidea (strain C-169) TaxID=574566 RepID=I0Z2E3_COCSC|nr:radical SAM enzyme [Coccomyxa subellipsoidea C-169]EIE24812.1 radical SAM enzyme [Coccomyxa subellipsoidea C-169]|eukprot:XP_005649356.1 radical SAM enzyme [Coccomyxa subellipsoidea C-169]
MSMGRSRWGAMKNRATSTRESVNLEPRAAYVHLPFCKRRCLYCDFPVVATGSRLNSPEIQDSMKAYVDTVIQEIKASTPLTDQPLQTVFFGGGTPSLIPPKQLDQIISALDKRFGIAAGAEISMEADPGTFDAERLREYMDLGLSRFSIGVQAFQEELLEVCGRSHSLYDVYKALEAVHAAAPPSWSLDLISGLPHLTEDTWHQSLSCALDAEPPHISVYDLQVEDKTPFAKKYTIDVKPLPSSEDGAEMYKAASSVLRSAGYEHYEVSNYARPGHRCKHNEVYWRGDEPYYAFGLGAASYLQSRRFSRPRQMVAYRKWVSQFASSGAGFPGSAADDQGKEDEMLDIVMMRLRTADGLDLRQFGEQFGSGAVRAVNKALEPHEEAALVVRSSEEGKEGKEGKGEGIGAREVVRLADPDGFLVSNDIISDVFAALMPDDGKQQARANLM